MERARAHDIIDGVIGRNSMVHEEAKATGHYHFMCRDKDGNIKWEDDIYNLVTVQGKNLALDTILSGSSYSVVGPYIGLISSVSFTAIAGADTMASHAGWLEAGGANAPTYSGNRITAVFDAASGASKSLTSFVVFTFTGAGTIKGCFLALGTGALNTKDNTAGTLYSVGLFSVDKVMANAETLTVSYTAGL